MSLSSSSGAFSRLQRPFGAPPLLFFALFLVASFITRVALLVYARHDVQWATLPGVFLMGFAYDLVAGLWSMLPVLFLYLLCPRIAIAKPIVKTIMVLALGASLYLLLFNLISELLFWNEFGVRYNFIAVDYLVYTHEVIGNIRESYPVGKILWSLLAATIVLLWLARRIIAASLDIRTGIPGRLGQVASWLLLLGVAWLASGLLGTGIFQNRYNAELASNGPYSFFAAFWDNELDYANFYVTLPSNKVRQTLGRLIAPDTNTVEQPRTIAAAGPEKHLNVVLISVESLSAEFLGSFGNQQHMTPNLDRIAGEGMLFTNFYATGTRTVRGLEALTLSVPPTPGQSIVKRPENAHLFSLGSIFHKKGYDVRYAYGGYGYFDNMNTFFSGNDYQIVDRMAIPSKRIPFENIWGVADEALFDQVLDELDASYRAGRPSFTHVMTTSNHRPYTYPEGRIDIPSHTGREGGVKYTDYAIGRFIDMARKKPWFHDTVFVIVADHCASSAGKTELPVDRYHIPLIVYAPAYIRPARVDRLASQIDTAPTLLGMLNFSYPTRFIGHDVLHTPASEDRAFISNYQALGYLRDGVLTVLRPKRQVAAYRIDAKSNETPIAVNQKLLEEAIAYYQGTAELYRGGLYRSLP